MKLKTHLQATKTDLAGDSAYRYENRIIGSLAGDECC